MLNAPPQIKLTQGKGREVEQHQSDGELHVVVPLKVAVPTADRLTDPNLEVALLVRCRLLSAMPEIHFPAVVGC